ncbi:hypothetical protein TRFO_05190 [Tritrichomonas foetus]|uniref:Uncharacterized protein n=1 Tax=Tritrichomonas foetus TaxID=1144522 RepID=A0A1J4KCX7_9EUKA|nr:hypothetical protein TRFO_05190 [Tritrichomonas foetus]|eukprot:OHT07556.1 hypothetical protein TRFO_05190 [Tritrichomonas foetus]
MPGKFVFQPASSSNNMKKLLENPTTPLVAILKHEMLGTTVRNELKAMVAYFFPPTEMEKSSPDLPRLEELLDYALTSKNENPNYKILQLNRNASNLLAHCFTKFMDEVVKDPCKRVARRLRNFINDSKNNTNPIICGHFQRIIENYFRHEPDEFTTDLNDGFTLDKLVDFLIDHVNILPYRELLSDILSEFSDLFGPNVVDKILLAAAKNVFSISLFITKNFNKSHQFSLSTALKKNKFTCETLQKIQPININKQKIPLPDFLLNEHYDEAMAPVILDESFLRSQQQFVKFNKKTAKQYTSLDEIIQLIYCLLSSIRLAAISETSIIEHCQNEKSIRLLLICGVFADSNSPISIEAFNLLYHIIYGYDNIPKMTEIPKIVDDFAANFIFDPESMTTQMFAAFPIFWNYRYDTVISESQEINGNKVAPYKVIDPNDFDKETKSEYPLCLLKKPYKKPKGSTPLEFLSPIFFSEPPLNTTFNVRFMEILERLNKERLDILGEETDANNLNEEDKKKLLEIDLIYFEFIRNRFDLNKENTNVTIFGALEVVTPLVTTDKFFHPDSMTTADEEQQKMHRVPLNGHILKLLQFLMDPNLSKFLDVSDEDPGIFYDFIPDRNKLSNDYFNATKQYEKLMKMAEKSAVILEHTQGTIPQKVDEFD